jgi:hypothetical protein
MIKLLVLIFSVLVQAYYLSSFQLNSPVVEFSVQLADETTIQNIKCLKSIKAVF